MDTLEKTLENYRRDMNALRAQDDVFVGLLARGDVHLAIELRKERRQIRDTLTKNFFKEIDMLHTPRKPAPPAQTKIRDASRKDWPGPRWPFVVVQNDDGSVSIPLPLNEH